MTTRLNNNELQIRVWSNDGADNPFTYPFHITAFSQDSAMGPVYGKWWQSAGKIGVKPEGDLLKQLELLEQAKGVPADKRVDIGKQILQLAVDNVWVIGTVGVSPTWRSSSRAIRWATCRTRSSAARPARRPATPGRRCTTSRVRG